MRILCCKTEWGGMLVVELVNVFVERTPMKRLVSWKKVYEMNLDREKTVVVYQGSGRNPRKQRIGRFGVPSSSTSGKVPAM
jgi:hypothetical protein